MNTNMQAIEKEIKRLQALKHKNKSEMTESEVSEVNYMISTPNFPSFKYYSPSGKEIDQCIGMIAFRLKRHIGHDIVGKFRISTVWLGMDHSCYRFGNDKKEMPPLIFETMIFLNEDMENHFHDFQDRYSSIKEAETGHQDTIKMVNDYLETLTIK